MIRVGILGATGYAGAELVRILQGHPNVEITIITSRQYAGVSFSEVYPSMQGIMDKPCETYHIDHCNDKVDVVFTALPIKNSHVFCSGTVGSQYKSY